MADDVKFLVGNAERAARIGELERASQLFVAAGRSAAAEQLWRVAVRCYRAALEIDLLDRQVVARLLGLGRRAGDSWNEYARAVDRVDWPHFGCRAASIVSGDTGTVVHCGDVGPVLSIAMREDRRVEAHAERAFVAMPFAMALVILRRALWSDALSLWPLPNAPPPPHVRVKFPAHPEVKLDALGDWQLA